MVITIGAAINWSQPICVLAQRKRHKHKIEFADLSLWPITLSVEWRGGVTTLYMCKRFYFLFAFATVTATATGNLSKFNFYYADVRSALRS